MPSNKKRNDPITSFVYRLNWLYVISFDRIWMILEVISTSPQDSRIIEESGAHRIELVSALEIGGITPPSSILRKSLEAVSIPTNVIIRHHNNGFFYSKE